MLDSNELCFQTLFARVADANGVDAQTVRTELQALCDKMRQTQSDFPETPEALVTAILTMITQQAKQESEAE